MAKLLTRTPPETGIDAPSATRPHRIKPGEASAIETYPDPMTRALEAHPEYWRQNRAGVPAVDWRRVPSKTKGSWKAIGDADLAELVRRRTDGGIKIVDAMLEVLAGLTPPPVKVRNKRTGEVHLRIATGEPTASDRVAAAKILADRGWGKPKETIEMKASVQVGTDGFDLARLSTDQVKAYLDILRAARGELTAGTVTVEGESRPVEPEPK